jgi:hypothetical protein
MISVPRTEAFVSFIYDNSHAPLLQSHGQCGAANATTHDGD